MGRSYKRTVRFDSEKNARRFAKKMMGDLYDLRDHEDRKSNFKVVYPYMHSREYGIRVTNQNDKSKWNKI